MVYGLEPDYPAACVARNFLDRVIGGDIEHLLFPFPRRFFECVMFDGTLERLADPIAFLAKLKPYLTFNGRILVRVSNPSHWTALRNLIESGWSSRGLPAPARDIFYEAGYRIAQEHFGQFGGDQVEALKKVATELGVDPASTEGKFEIAETIFILEPLKPVIDESTACQLGSPSLKGTSVIVLTYNSASTIESCLNSLVPTLGPEDELLVVDNASSDETTSIVQRIAADRGGFIQNQENLGFSAGCNVGLKQSRGTTVCLLNPDTEVGPNWLEKLRSRLDSSQVGMVGPLSDNVAGIQNVGNWLVDGKLDLGRLPGQSVESKLIIGLCAMFRRETLDKVGLLDENLFLGSDDLEISWRLRTHGLKLLVAQDVFIHHVGEQSFASEKKEKVSQLLFESTEACLAKIRAACGWRPSDRLLWGFDICHT